MVESIPAWYPIAFAVLFIFVACSIVWILIFRATGLVRGRREWIGAQTVKPIPVPKITLPLGQTTTLVNVQYEVCYSIVGGQIRLHKARLSDGKLNGGSNASSFRGFAFRMPDGVVSSRQLLDLARAELAEPDSGLKRRMFGRWNEQR